MMIADVGGIRQYATPDIRRGVCPSCRQSVRGKCGEIIVWHWAHEANDCDPWSEGESAWHQGWKRRFAPEFQEVIVGNHRADVKTPTLVIELQASPITPQEIRERERHYGRMIWLLRGEDFRKNIHFRKRDGHDTFWWRWPRKSWWAAKCPIIIDLGELFLVRKIHNDVPCHGWGHWMCDREIDDLAGLTVEPTWRYYGYENQFRLRERLQGDAHKMIQWAEEEDREAALSQFLRAHGENISRSSGDAP